MSMALGDKPWLYTRPCVACGLPWTNILVCSCGRSTVGVVMVLYWDSMRIDIEPEITWLPMVFADPRDEGLWLVLDSPTVVRRYLFGFRQPLIAKINPWHLRKSIALIFHIGTLCMFQRRNSGPFESYGVFFLSWQNAVNSCVFVHESSPTSWRLFSIVSTVSDPTYGSDVDLCLFVFLVETELVTSVAYQTFFSGMTLYSSCVWTWARL